MHKQQHLLKKGQVFGRWTLICHLGSGGNGDVWVAKGVSDQQVAIKFLRRLDEPSYKRFKAEISTLKKYDTLAGIVPLIDQSFPDDKILSTPWYAMPLAIEFEKHLGDRSTASIVEEFAKIAETLTALHEEGVAHRDIKPQNLLALDARLCISDFGLVKYPEREPITPHKQDVGAKFTMAPDMRRNANNADGLPADVYSLAKTLWIALTKENRGFDGQYVTGTVLDLKNYNVVDHTSQLDTLMSASTDNDPLRRPTAKQFASRLREWLELRENFHKRNLLEWAELNRRLFPLVVPTRAEWTDLSSICSVLKHVGEVQALNHMFFPSGGGNTITQVECAGEQGCIEIEALGTYIFKPEKLTLESFEHFGDGNRWNYFRIEAAQMKPVDQRFVSLGGLYEYLTEIKPGQYGDRDIWEYPENYYGPDFREQYDADFLAKMRPITRYLRGSFVIFSTRSPYNLDNGTYDARHDKMSADEFRNYIQRNIKRSQN